jgi:hypothetical protein
LTLSAKSTVTKFPSELDDVKSYHSTVVQFVQEVYQHLFCTAIGIDEVDKAIRVCIKLSAEKFSEEDPGPMNDNEIAWGSLHLVFDCLVPAGDENPDVVQLDLGNDTTLARRDWKSARIRIDDTVRLLDRPGIARWQ